jgi:hypothetical protein
MGRPTYEAPTREYTHKHTQTKTNTQLGPRKYGADSRRGGALLIRGGRLAPTPPASRTYRGDTEVHAPKESKANQSSSVKAVDISQHILRERSTGPPPRYIRMATNNLHTLNRRRGRAGFCRLLLWDTLKYSIGLNPHPETLHDYGSKPTIMQVVNHIRT